jgi:hypothetical protein
MYITVLIGCLIFLSYKVQAHDRRGGLPRIESLLTEADGVFVGEVINVEYSKNSANDLKEILPHTFVTYKIKESLKGSPQQSTLTLRFLGGRGEQAQFLSVSNYPLFDVGDMDVVFVKNNQRFTCPLLYCAQGRYRLINSRVYFESGHQVLRTPKEQLAKGLLESLEPILSHQVSKTIIKTITQAEPGEQKTEEGPLPGKHFGAGEFVEYLNKKIAVIDPNQAWKKLPVIPAADPRAPFTIKGLIPISAKKALETPVSREFQTPQEKREWELLERNGGNPVIKE